MEKNTNTQTNKVVVLSGGSGYVGSAITHRLREAGFIVVTLERNVVANEDGSVVHLRVDVTNETSVEQAAHQVALQFGNVVAVIVAASAPFIRTPLLTQTSEEFESQLRVNANGVFIVCKYFCPLLSPGGTVIGITTKAIEAGARYTPSGSYLSAKYALRGLLRALSEECKEKTIEVCAVAPAFMPGGLNKDMPPTVLNFIKEKSRTEDITSPEEVAALVCDLVEKKITPIHGKTITVPGHVITDL